MNSEYDFLFKILLLGDSGVGKSCIILRYTENQFSQNLMNSIGVDFKLKNIFFKEKNIKLQIWDTAGQERFRTITTSYYKGAQAIVIVYDITDKESFDHVKNWMLDIDKFAKEGVLRILVGNKCDLDKKRQVSYSQAKEFGKDLLITLADKYGIKFLETSAKDTLNIDELFNSIAEKLLEKQTNIGVKSDKKNKAQGNVVNIQNTPTQGENGSNNSGCC